MIGKNDFEEQSMSMSRSMIQSKKIKKMAQGGGRRKKPVDSKKNKMRTELANSLKKTVSVAAAAAQEPEDNYSEDSGEGMEWAVWFSRQYSSKITNNWVELNDIRWDYRYKLSLLDR